MLQYAGLSSRHADRQRLAICHAKLDDISAVALRTVDHDAVLAARRSHAHLRRSFDQSSSAGADYYVAAKCELNSFAARSILGWRRICIKHCPRDLVSSS